MDMIRQIGYQVETPQRCESFVGCLLVNFRYGSRQNDYGRTRGILFANRNKGQRDQISETILETKLRRLANIAWHAAKMKHEVFPQQLFVGGLENG